MYHQSPIASIGKSYGYVTPLDEPFVTKPFPRLTVSTVNFLVWELRDQHGLTNTMVPSMFGSKSVDCGNWIVYEGARGNVGSGKVRIGGK